MAKNPEKSLEIRKILARKIWLGMKDKGWSQKRLAEEMQVTPSWVSQLVNAKTDICLSTLVELEDLLDIHLLNKS